MQRQSHPTAVLESQKIQEAKDEVRKATVALESALATLSGSRAEEYVRNCKDKLDLIFMDLVLAKRLVK